VLTLRPSTTGPRLRADLLKHDGGWRQLSHKYLYQSKWYDLRQDQVRLPNDDEITYTLVEHPGYALIVPLLDDGTVLLEQVYRYTVQETVLECPSGGLDQDTPLVAAHRELREETGYLAREMQPLGTFFGANGISNEQFYVFMAQGLTLGGEPERENTEQIDLEFVPFEQAYKMAINAQIKDGPSALGLILSWNHIHKTT
jgi:ADP-ribose pyrophosphatase